MNNLEPKPIILPQKNSSKKRTLLFKAIAILLPFLVLFMIEILLRVFNYGYDFSLFIEYKGNENYLVLNPAASKKYFVNQALAPSGNRELFKKEKDKNTLRIFVLGESTTIGYPYFHNGSFHRWLLYRMMRTFPDRNFEIINISLTAVNSYTVLDFAKGLVDFEPDAVLIYTGHNEYYGTLGVGSTSRIGSNPVMIKIMLVMRRFRLTQLLTNLYEKLFRPAAVNIPTGGETLMRMMVADQQIPYQSKLYYKGIDQFTSNLDETLRQLNRFHIPVFVSNLVSNEKDMKPFVSIEPDSIQFHGFKENYELGLKAIEINDPKSAYSYLMRADQIYGAHALCNYYLGQLAYLKADYSAAKAYFGKARDLDGLRFRAPGKLNEIINQLCGKYPFAHVVDAKKAFESYSDNQIIGKELMLEHVHPNLKGYAILSEAFYEAMKKVHIFSVSSKNEMDFQQLLREMPITAVDSIAGIFRIGKLKKSWPFNEVNSPDSFKVVSEEEKLAYSFAYGNLQWPDTMDSAYNYYLSRQDLGHAKSIMETLVLEHPTEAAYYEGTAMICGKLNDLENAAFYFRRAFAMSPSFDKARMLFVIYLKLDQPSDAIPYLDYATKNNTSNFNLFPVKKSAEEVIQWKGQLSQDSLNTKTLYLIANKYAGMGNKEGASKYIGIILEHDPGNKAALELNAKIKNP
jgi:hypothetical protein